MHSKRRLNISALTFGSGWLTISIAVFLTSSLGFVQYALAAAAVLVIATIAFSLPGSERRNSSVPDFRVPYRSLSISFAISATDVFNWANHGPNWRYAIIIPAVCLAAASDGSKRRQYEDSHSADSSPLTGDHRSRLSAGISLKLLTIYGIICVSYLVFGILLDDFNGDNYTIALPPIMLLFYSASYAFAGRRNFGATRLEKISRSNQLWSDSFSIVAFIYCATALADAVRSPQGMPPVFANHETIFVVVVSTLLTTRMRRLTAVVAIAAVAISTLRYPTATILLILVVGAILISVCKAFSGRSVKVAVAVVGSAAGVMLLRYGQSAINVFYSNSSRTNNTETREVLWAQGLEVVYSNPLFGGHGTETITAEAIINGRLAKVPLHNTLLTLAVYGGAILVALLVMLIATAAILSLRGVAANNRVGLIAILSLTSVTSSLLFNPVLDKLGIAVCFYAVLLWLVTQPNEKPSAVDMRANNALQRNGASSALFYPSNEVTK